MSVLYPETFLDLVKRTFIECGCSGEAPTTVVGVTGEASRVTNWVSSAWLSLQQVHEDWQFLEASFSFATTAGQATYTPVQAGITAGTFGQWKTWDDLPRNYLTATGTDDEFEMDEVSFDAWRALYDFGALKNVRTRPVVFAVTPAKSLALGPYPLVGYTVTGKYFTAPVSMSLDADVPTLPRQYLLAIVGGAMMEYAAFKASSEVYQRGKQWHDQYVGRLEHARLPRMQSGGALA
ncbi:MAG: hypothetical protein Q7R68_10990 [Nitrospirales bacterium]|nr:hypothetical protein [Nitrospirales bacterium]